MSGRPVRVVPPVTVAPGRVQEALGLVLAHAFPLGAHQQRLVLWVLVDPKPDGSAARAAERVGVSPRRVRQLVGQAAAFARTVPAPDNVVQGVRLLQDGGIRTDRELSAALLAANVVVDSLSAATLLRIAGLFGLKASDQVDSPGLSGSGGAQLLDVEWARGRGPEASRGNDGGVVVVPARERDALHGHLRGLCSVLRHQVAVAVPGPASSVWSDCPDSLPVSLPNHGSAARLSRPCSRPTRVWSCTVTLLRCSPPRTGGRRWGRGGCGGHGSRRVGACRVYRYGSCSGC